MSQQAVLCGDCLHFWRVIESYSEWKTRNNVYYCTLQCPVILRKKMYRGKKSWYPFLRPDLGHRCDVMLIVESILLSHLLLS